jgi:effector-binding domain-containing protein
MIEQVGVASVPMYYVTTRTSERPSSIASTIKSALAEVSSFLDENGIRSRGRPFAVFEDWNGRLVTVEAGYPVSEDSLRLASGRVQAGYTPRGPAARTVYTRAAPDFARQHADFVDRLRQEGVRTTGTTWEVYFDDVMTGNRRTELYAKLIAAT